MRANTLDDRIWRKYWLKVIIIYKGKWICDAPRELWGVRFFFFVTFGAPSGEWLQAASPPDLCEGEKKSKMSALFDGPKKNFAVRCFYGTSCITVSLPFDKIFVVYACLYRHLKYRIGPTIQKRSQEKNLPFAQKLTFLEHSFQATTAPLRPPKALAVFAYH